MQFLQAVLLWRVRSIPCLASTTWFRTRLVQQQLTHTFVVHLSSLVALVSSSPGKLPIMEIVFLLERTTVEPNSFIAFKSVYGMALLGESLHECVCKQVYGMVVLGVC